MASGSWQLPRVATFDEISDFLDNEMHGTRIETVFDFVDYNQRRWLGVTEKREQCKRT